MKKFLIISLVLFVLLGVSVNTKDQFWPVTAENLETEAIVQPVGSLSYRLSDFWRGISLFFTINDLRKIEKRINYNNQRLLALKLILEDEQAIDQIDQVVKKISKQITNILEEISDIKTVDKNDIELFKKINTDIINQTRLLNSLSLNSEYKQFLGDKLLSVLAKSINVITEPEEVVELWQASIKSPAHAWINYELWLYLEKTSENEDLFAFVEAKLLQSVRQALTSTNFSEKIGRQQLIEALQKEYFNDWVGVYLLEKITKQSFNDFTEEELKSLDILKGYFLQNIRLTVKNEQIRITDFEKLFYTTSLLKLRVLINTKPYISGVYNEVFVYLYYQQLEELLDKYVKNGLQNNFSNDVFQLDIFHQLQQIVEPDQFDILLELEEEWYKQLDKTKDFGLFGKYTSSLPSHLDLIVDQKNDLPLIKSWQEPQIDRIIFNLLNTESIEVLKQLEKDIFENDDVWNIIRLRVSYLHNTIKERKIELDEDIKRVLDLVEEFEEHGVQ